MKKLTGVVKSTAMEKTVVVEVNRFVAHPLYQKRMRKTKRYHAHCEIKVAVGDTVEMVSISPMSKTKFFKIDKVITKA